MVRVPFLRMELRVEIIQGIRKKKVTEIDSIPLAHTIIGFSGTPT
jgi:hypothetical protein